MTSAKNKCFAKISLIYQAITENAATLVVVSTLIGNAESFKN